MPILWSKSTVSRVTVCVCWGTLGHVYVAGGLPKEARVFVCWSHALAQILRSCAHYVHTTVTHCEGQCSVTWPRPCPALGSSAEAHLWSCLPQSDCLFEPSALACSSLLCCFSSDWLMAQLQCVHAHAWRVIVCPCMQVCCCVWLLRAREEV